ncbi:MAG: sigma 54-interacting transcriptional regulator [Firmicutes bacterium]|nr:sigma 54-interacting transcriptional regulator [Bacillota bacterium]
MMEELMDSLDVMKDILDNAYQGMVLIDKEGRIIKWNYENLLGIKEKDVLDKHVEEVIENTRLHIVIKTGEKEICKIQRIQGHDMLASRIPIKKDDEVIGAVGTVLFRDIEEIRTMAKRVEILEKTVGKYKDEISQMYSAKYTFKDIITQNDKMQELKEIARKAAGLNSTILIQGESGTGKEFFAHAIHNASDRVYNPFIQINCAAIPHELLESELFGYEGGAFTGAKKGGKIGKFELGNGGTILLDEISTMTYSMQAKLLRVLEEREFERIGGNIRIKSDVRIISCTNENLHTAVQEGRFRQDLYYRLNVVGIDIPPLRDRLDDIPVLSLYILKELVDKMGFSYIEVSDSAMKCLKLYNWPGNVRELRNVLERAANIATGKYIYPEHLPDSINRKLCISDGKKEIKLLKDKVAEAEINAIMEALKFTNGSRTKAARRLGIHRTALYKKLSGYGINIKEL